MRKRQSGVMLLEALIAILIFSLGILGVVGLQAAAIGASNDAKYRADAAMLANEVIGQMWGADRSVDKSGANSPALKTAFEGGTATDCSATPPATPYCAWRLRVQGALPGVAANPPLIAVTAGAIDLPALTDIQPDVVSITVQWQAPKDSAAHRYTVLSLVPQTN